MIAGGLFFLVACSLCSGFVLNGSRLNKRVVDLVQRASSKLVARRQTEVEIVYQHLQANEIKPSYSEKDAFRAMVNAGVAMGDNFWETTFPLLRRNRLAATQKVDQHDSAEADTGFNDLMQAGFDRRLLSEYLCNTEDQSVDSPSEDFPAAILRECAKITSDHLELSVTKDEQLRQLKRKQLQSRSGFMRLLPQSLHKYVDYVSSLRKDPKPGDLIRNLVVGAVFATVALLNARARMAALYAGIGHLALMSILLMRNMPQSGGNLPMGLEKKTVSWSGTAARTAVGLSVWFGATAGLAVGGALYFLPTLDPSLKVRIALAASVLWAGLCTSYYEVFEEKSKDGWRWKRALEGLLPDDVQARLKKQVFGAADTPMTEMYDYAYDPEVDDYPPKPKYLDEVEGAGADGQIAIGGSGELDEEAAAAHFAQWKADRKDARKAPVLDACPEDKWVGAKKGLFVDPDAVPKWLNSAYNKNVLQANRWRGQPAKYEKNTAEFDPIEGPVGFRDKRPEWLDMFGPGIWEEKLLASRAAARAFGSYRKTMWKVDPKVVLQPCDGVDKEPK